MESGSSLDEWRNYFRTANSDIFDVIDHAIIVAACDYPKEFRVKRDGIAERLFSCKFTRCLGCDQVELAVGCGEKEQDGDGGGDGGCQSGFEGHDDEAKLEAGVSKESNVNSCSKDENGDMDVNHVSNYSFGEAEALTDEIEEETQYVGEILRIKEILANHEDESESVLYDSLRRLQLMELTVDCLKATEIGKAVNPLRKHGSKDIRQLARTLIQSWIQLVDQWCKATSTAVAEGTPDSVNPSVIDDEEEQGLPSPPMDEGAFFVASTGSIELSQFFDGMDDDGNPPESAHFNKNRENGRKPELDNQDLEQKKSNEATMTSTKDSKSQLTKKNEASVRPNKPVTADFGQGRPPKSNIQRKSNIEPKMQQKKENGSITRRPPSGLLDKSKSSDEAAVQVKLEATKRKLQESYQQAENAKRQRTIQVVEINDLPKQGVVQRNPHFKPGYSNRHWANSRR